MNRFCRMPENVLYKEPSGIWMFGGLVDLELATAEGFESKAAAVAFAEARGFAFDETGGPEGSMVWTGKEVA